MTFGEPFRFTGLVPTEPESPTKGRRATLTVSLVLHGVLIGAVVLIPILIDQSLPTPGEGVRAFFVTPPVVAPPPPPPPPPPAAGTRVVRRAPAAPRPSEPPKFVAPIDPAEIKPEEGLDLGLEGGVPGGVEGGAPGGVEGGVEGGLPGGVVGGIIGGLPAEAPPPKVVRVGGSLVAPKLVRQVKPAYPDVAAQARVRQGLVILEAHVDVHGAVKSVKVLRAAPLFEEAAVEAVRQWRYHPLLQNGVPTEFILTVTVVFNLTTAAS